MGKTRGEIREKGPGEWRNDGEKPKGGVGKATKLGHCAN